MSDPITVSDIFRRALDIRAAHPEGSYADVKKQLINDLQASEFPDTAFLTIPEYDNVAPEEDWTAGLPVVLRGIQNKDWNDVIHGIIISLEQVENFPRESGREDDPAKEWRDRSRRISGAEEKVLEEWMPSDLMAIAKRSAAKDGR